MKGKAVEVEEVAGGKGKAATLLDKCVISELLRSRENVFGFFVPSFEYH